MTFLCILIGHCCGEMKEIISFCHDNGYKHLTFVKISKLEIYEGMSLSFKYGIQSRFSSNYQPKLSPKDFLILNLRNFEDFDKALNLISSHEIQRSLAIVDDFEIFKIAAKNHMKNSLFYIYHDQNWKQALIINGNPQVVINDISFRDNGLAIIQHDLQGLKLITTSMTWNPQVIISACDSQGLDCNYEGFLVDLMNLWSKKLNYTWKIHQNEDWGLIPKSGKSCSRIPWFQKSYLIVTSLVSEGYHSIGIIQNLQKSSPLINLTVTGRELFFSSTVFLNNSG